MLDLATQWLGMRLRSPLVVAASPLSDDIESLARFVQAGAGAVVMRSLFEEQIIAEQLAAHRYIDSYVDSNAEARSFLPDSEFPPQDCEPYLAQLRRLRARLDVPVLASLNGATPGGWTATAARLEEAGASAIELNLYEVATDPGESGSLIEERQIDTARAVVARVDIPVSVKISPYYASVPAFAERLAQVGVRGIVLFNRFYQPDVRLETLDLDLTTPLSTPAELPLRLHGLALLHGRVSLSLAATGGVHNGLDAAKAILCGADVVQMASALLIDGPDRMASTLGELSDWLTRKGYRSADEARGVMSLNKAPNPGTWERVNYLRVLQGWRAPAPRGSRYD